MTKTTKKTANKKPAAAKKTTNAKQAAAKPGVDRFGSRKGTKLAAFNAAFTKKPQTMAALMEKAGTEQTFYNHTNKLIAAGYVVKLSDGYRLA